MRREFRVVALIAAALVLFGVFVVGLPTLFVGQVAQASCPSGDAPPVAPPSGQVAGFGRWDAGQVSNATVILAVGQQGGAPARAWVIAVATAMQESSLHNLNRGDQDSVGLFQQRPSQGWGTVVQLLDPRYASRKFYAKLLDVPGWQQMRLTDAAQPVQRSGTPEAYQQWEDEAEAVAAHVLGLPNLDAIGGGNPAAPCGPTALGPVPVGPGGWVQPVRAPIVSPYGPRPGGFHAGVDLGAPRGTPIRAASSGVVVVSRCQSGTGTCDRDGGVEVTGCGWYIDIRHPGNIITRYCHMGSRPEVAVGETVRAGQVIGYIGSSGNSSGPHLDYEVHSTSQPASPPTAPTPLTPRGSCCESVRLSAKANCCRFWLDLPVSHLCVGVLVGYDRSMRNRRWGGEHVRDCDCA